MRLLLGFLCRCQGILIRFWLEKGVLEGICQTSQVCSLRILILNRKFYISIGQIQKQIKELRSTKGKHIHLAEVKKGSQGTHLWSLEDYSWNTLYLYDWETFKNDKTHKLKFKLSLFIKSRYKMTITKKREVSKG